MASTWRGLKIAKENRCASYNREKDYLYSSKNLEDKIIESLNKKIYSPYSGQMFSSKTEVDIDHIVSLSEAHDSGLCAKNKATKSKFASDINNLTLASSALNRGKKSSLDAAGWVPEKNQCWFANTVIAVKKAYGLTVDSNELIALERIISKCKSFEMIFYSIKNKKR